MTMDGRHPDGPDADCASVDELLPGFVLDGLEAPERAFVEAHLAGCARHAELPSLEGAALWLAESAPEMEPPSSLRDRILAIPREAADAPPLAVQTAPVVLAERRAERSWLPYAMAAAFAALALFLGAWNVMLQTAGNGTTEVVVREAVHDTVHTRVVYLPAEQLALVSFEGLPALPEGQDYQLWAIPPAGPPRAVGVMAPAEGAAMHSVPGDFAAGSTIAVTVEPAGGSLQPTTEPIAAATF